MRYGNRSFCLLTFTFINVMKDVSVAGNLSTILIYANFYKLYKNHLKSRFGISFCERTVMKIYKFFQNE